MHAQPYHYYIHDLSKVRSLIVGVGNILSTKFLACAVSTEKKLVLRERLYLRLYGAWYNVFSLILRQSHSATPTSLGTKLW